MEFEINFLPQNRNRWLAHVKGKELLIAGLVLAFIITVSFIGFYSKGITKKPQKLVAIGQDFLKVSQEKGKVSGVAALLSKLKKERLNWTEKMASLSDATPSQVFLTSLEYSKEKTGARGSSNIKNREKLVIKGVVIPSGEESPSSSIQSFMQNLKNNASFMAGFEAPVLISVNNSQKEGQGEGLEFEFQLLRKQDA
jgi:hypothetical protein